MQLMYMMQKTLIDATVLSMTLNCSSHTLCPVFCHSQRLFHTIISHYYALTQYIPKPLCNITNTCEQIMNTEQYRMICSFFIHFCLSVYTHNLPCDIEKSVAILDYTPIFKILYKKLQSFFIKKCSVHSLLIYLFVYFYYIYLKYFIYIICIFYLNNTLVI